MSAGLLPPKRNRWFVLVDSKVYGPFDKTVIAQMVNRNQLLNDDKVHIEGGSRWITANQEAELAALFPSGLTAPKSARPRRNGRWIGLAVAVTALFGLGWTAWPYYSLFSLIKAVREGDVPTLERRVDWNAVRLGLRGDLNAGLLKSVSDKSQGSDSALANGFAAMLGPAVINNLIDGYVTPQGIAAMAKNEKQSQSDDAPLATKHFNAVKNIDWSKVKYAFFAGGPFSFRVELEADGAGQEPLGFDLEWKGDWRLVRVAIPASVFDNSSKTPKAENARAPAAPTSANPATKVVEPSPIEISLVSKRFRDTDFSGSNYIRAAITFELSITNKTGQPIRAFDGILVFSDVLDNEIHSTKFAMTDPVAANATALKWRGEIDFNQFTNSHIRLRNESLDNIKLAFRPRKVLYADGTTKEFK